MEFDDIAKGIVAGLLVGFLVIYSLRPQMPYPEWVLQTYEHPWIFVLLVSATLVLACWDAKVGALLALVVATLFVDYYTLGKRSLRSKDAEDNDESFVDMPRVTKEEFKPLMVAPQDASPLDSEQFEVQPGEPDLF